MAISVSFFTLNGMLMESVTFPGPSVKVLELRALVKETQSNQVFDLSIGDRVLSDDEELADPELIVTITFDTDYASMPIKTFEELNLHEDVLRGIYSYGFEQPSGLQQSAIRPMIDGRDLIVQAQSGTGKTASYVVGGLQRIDITSKTTQILVLAPTRELACPIQKVAIALGEFMRVTSLFVGGADIQADLAKFHEAPQFVVGTPGRVCDIVTKRHLELEALKMFVLDEADEMMSRGFKGLIYETVEFLPADVQLAVFSSTMSPEVLDAIKRFLKKPVRLEVKKEELTLEGIRQFYVAIEKEEHKVDTLIDMIEEGFLRNQSVIYCNTRRKVDYLAHKLGEHEVEVSVMHADLDCRERETIMSKFVPGASGILISTDLLVRGTDVPLFPVVINFDLPPNMDNYLHRVGRSGRFGRKGVAINMVTNNDVRTMKEIMQYYHTQIEEMPIDILDLI